MRHKLKAWLDSHVLCAMAILELLGLLLLFCNSFTSLNYGVTNKLVIILETVALGFVISTICILFYFIARLRQIAPEGDQIRIFLILSMLLLLCILFASLYAIILIITPDAFDFGRVLSDNWLSRGINLLYFSVATFTTLGYGDIVPVSLLAKVIVSIEALSFSVGIAFVLTSFCVNGNKGDKTDG